MKAVVANGSARFVIPAGTVIPPRGHYLGAHNGYTLSAVAAPNRPYTTEIEDDSGVAIFASSTDYTPATRRTTGRPICASSPRTARTSP